MSVDLHAEAPLAPYRERLNAYFRSVAAYEAAQMTAHRIARAHHAWEPLDAKSDLIEADDVVDVCRREMEIATADALLALQEALAGDPGNQDAREAMADYYWFQCQEAEADDEKRNLIVYERLLRAFDDGKYREDLAATGVVSVESDPPQAQASLWKFQQAGFVRELVKVRDLGPTPVAPFELDRGSYVIKLNAPGRRETIAPVFIQRRETWSLNVRLCTEAEIGDEFVHVPAGRFIMGGDEDGTHGWALPRSEQDLPDFCIARHPVTLGEYLEFLTDLGRRSPEEAQARAPRTTPMKGHYVRPDETGVFRLPDGPSWKADLPVFGVSWNDAVAYAAWRSQRDGRPYRLPTEAEWEKAARGVDGSWHPWGPRFDPCLCNMRDSREVGPGPVGIHEFPTDVSVYGVRGMGGNVRDWTSTQVNGGEGEAAELGFQRWVEARDTRIVKGGAWSPLRPRAADRYWLGPDLVFAFIGFRLAHSL